MVFRKGTKTSLMVAFMPNLALKKALRGETKNILDVLDFETNCCLPKKKVRHVRFLLVGLIPVPSTHRSYDSTLHQTTQRQKVSLSLSVPEVFGKRIASPNPKTVVFLVAFPRRNTGCD